MSAERDKQTYRDKLISALKFETTIGIEFVRNKVPQRKILKTNYMLITLENWRNYKK